MVPEVRVSDSGRHLSGTNRCNGAFLCGQQVKACRRADFRTSAQANKSGRWGVTFIRDCIVKDDLFKPHTFEELRGLVVEGLLSQEVLSGLDPEGIYGVA